MKSKGRGKTRKRSRTSSSDDDGDDGDLVKTEIDAAEALAEFSKQAASFPAARGRGSGGAAGGPRLQWLRKRRRSGRGDMESSSSNMVVVSNSAVDFPLVKDEYPSDSDKERLGGGGGGGSGGGGLPLVAYNRFDTSEDSLEPGFRAESPSSPLPPLGTEGYSAYVKNEAGVLQQCSFKSSSEYDEKPKAMAWSRARAIKQPKLEELRAKESRRGSCGKGRSARTVLTEEEKEIRRLRRIEANRESARQTIRRKQKMCEEMTLKASELSLANERYRKEIEAILEENRQLYEAGCSLRKQLADKNIELGSAFPATLVEESTICPSGDGFKEPMTETVQVNRQDDNVDEEEEEELVETAAAESNQTSPPPTRTPPPTIPTQTQVPVESFAKIVAPNCVRGYYSCPVQHYSFYTGRKDALAAAAAAQARRRRKELTRSKNTLARQVSLNS